MAPINGAYLPGPTANTVRTVTGENIAVPAGWQFVPPGDAALTRRVKAAGDHWVVAEKKGRRVFSRGLWAPAATVEQIQADLAQERSSSEYARRIESGARRRQAMQAQYVAEFKVAVLEILAFHPRHAALAIRLAEAVTAQATPVGSGTVARTRRIPIERRARAALIAWMRHQTTAYDSLSIPRVRGKRREIRRMLAKRSDELLNRYRRGELAEPNCPLCKALCRTVSD